MKHPAFRHEFRTGCTVNRPIHAPAAEERRISGIHDGIDVERGDVGLDDLKVHV